MKCRICLGNKKNLITSIFGDGKDKDTSYANMMQSIANVKVNEDDGITDKICDGCQKTLKNAYDFKLLIERSDATLNKNIRKIHFNNNNDFKIQIEIEKDSKQCITKYEDVRICFENGVDEISYYDTVIKKKEKRVDDFREEPIPVLQFLNSIKKEEVDNSDIDNFDSDPYDPGSDSDHDYVPQAKLIKNDKPKRKYTKRKTLIEKKPSNNNTCIKPVYLDDLKLIYNYSTKSKKNKKTIARKEREHICPHCGILTKTLKNHILLHSERNYKCEECDKGYFSKSSLINHMKKHDTDRVFKCQECIAAFQTKQSLKSHMLIHSTEKKHICDVCNKAFKRRNALKRHRLLHNSASKTVMCEQCNMSFYNKFGLQHHMRVHTGERPYNCEICSQPYSYKHDFNRHCIKKHGVFLKRRSVFVMNEEVLKQEKILMRDLMLRVHGIIKDDKPLNPFEGPQAVQAFQQAVKALESRQIPVDLPL